MGAAHLLQKSWIRWRKNRRAGRDFQMVAEAEFSEENKVTDF